MKSNPQEIHVFLSHNSTFQISREPLREVPKNVSFSSHVGKWKQEWKGHCQDGRPTFCSPLVFEKVQKSRKWEGNGKNICKEKNVSDKEVISKNK